MSNYEFWDELGKIFSAVVAYQEKTVEFNDRFITPWIRLGNVFDKQDRSKESISAYRKAIAIDPTNPKTWYELGNTYFQMNDFENAVEAYQKASELAPDSGWAFNNLALALVSQGKHEEAIPLYQTSIGLLQDDKDKAVAWNRLGNAYRKLNNYEQAVNAFTQADVFDSENAGFRDELDDVSDGPSLVEAEQAEGQDGSEVVDPIQMVLDNSQELDIAAEVMSTDLELTEEAIAVVDEEPASEPTAEVVSETQAEIAPEIISESEPVLESVEETLEAVSEVAIEDEVEQIVIADEIEEEIESEEIAQPEAIAELEAFQPVKSKTVLEIVEEVIAKVLAKSSAEKIVEDEPVLETDAELPAAIEEPVAVVEEIENPLAEVEEQENQIAFAELELVNEVQQALDDIEVVASEPTSEIETEAVAQPVEEAVLEVQAEPQPEDELVEDSSMAAGDLVLDIDQDQAAQLIAQNVSETFTDTLFVVNTETETSDASLLIVENTVDQNIEVQVEVVNIELSVDEQNIVEEEMQVEPANVAYEEFLKDNNGHFKIFVHESAKENEAAQDSLLPAELMAKIDSTGEIQIEADAKNAHVWNELGNVYFNSGSYEDAVTAYSKSIELDRQFAWPYSNLALVYVQKGRFAEAMLLYQRSIELFSNDKDKAISWNRLGNVYRRLNDYDNAIAAYQRADELDTDNTTLSLQSRFSLLGNYQMEKKPSYAA